MPVRTNTITTEQVVTALDKEFVESFNGEYDRFAEIMGLFPAEVYAAGTALYQYKVTGALEDGKTETGSGDAKSTLESSGSEYVEGDFIKRSLYKVEKELVGEIEFKPYAKQTTAQAILKGGFENAVLRTDKKANQQLRASILNDFFALLANGTTTATGKGLQKALAQADANLGDVLEANDEDGGRIVYFVSRQDAAAYLGDAPVTMQDAFGMTYLEHFLGVNNVVLTNKVDAGKFYATPVDNIHVYGLDFAALGSAGLVYETSSNGLVGVHHKADYDHASAETYLVRGASFVPEVKDFIVKGTVTK